MSYSVGSRYTSPYRSVGSTSVRKDHDPSGRRSTYNRIDQRDGGSSSPRRYGGDNRYSGIPDSDATVSTNVLNGMIDNALKTPSTPSYRSASTSRVPRDYDQDSQLRSNAGSKPYHRPRDMSEPRITSNSDAYSRSVSTSPVRTSTYRTRDPSPQYNRDNGSYSSNRHRDERDEKRAYDSERNRREYDDSRHSRDERRASESDRNRRELDDSRHSRTGRSYAGGRSEYDDRWSRSDRSYAGGRSEYDDRGSRYGREYNDSRSSRGRAYEPVGQTSPSHAEYRNSGVRTEHNERGSRYGGRDYEDRSRVEERNYGNGESIGRRDNEDRNRMEYSRGGRENVDDLDERNKYAPSPSIHMRDGRHVGSHSQMPPRIPAISNVDDLDERNKHASSPSIHMRDGRHVESHSQMPPRIPAISNRRQADIPQNTFQHSARGVQPAQSDLSSMTGAVTVTFPTPTSARGISTRAVASMASVPSASYNDDEVIVIAIPKWTGMTASSCCGVL